MKQYYLPLFLLFIIFFTFCLFLFVPTSNTVAQEKSEQAVDALFDIIYEPIGDGTEFIATIYLSETTHEIAGISMNLDADSVDVSMIRNEISDCTVLDVNVICNPRADFAGLEGYEARWNWVSTESYIEELPYPFIQLKFTCESEGVVQPIVGAEITDIVLDQLFLYGTGKIALREYICPSTEETPQATKIPPTPTNTPTPTPLPTKINSSVIIPTKTKVFIVSTRVPDPIEMGSEFEDIPTTISLTSAESRSTDPHFPIWIMIILTTATIGTTIAVAKQRNQ